MSWLTFREPLWNRKRKSGDMEQQRRKVNAVLAELQQADLITSEECKRLPVLYDMRGVANVQKGKSPEVMFKTAELLRRHGFEKESNFLAVLAELQQADLITSEECEGLSDISGVVQFQKGKSPEVMSKTAEVLRRHELEKESNFLAVLAELRQTNLITSEECKMQPPSGLFLCYVRQELSDISGVVRVQKGKSPEVMSKTAEVLRKHGLEKESNFLAVLAELQQANLITSEECKMRPPSGLFFSRYVREELSDISGVVRVQSGKSPEVMSKTAEVLRRHEFEKESRLLAVLAELQQADLITSEECKRLRVRNDLWWYNMSDVVDVQKGKSPEVMSKTAEVLRRHGFEKESRLLAVLGELRQADLITSEECKRLSVRYDMSDVVEVQKGKSPEVMTKSAEVLRQHGFDEESTPLAVKAVLAELQQADLISSEECEELQHINDYDISGVVRVQKGKSPEVVFKTAEVLRRHGFEKWSKLLPGPTQHPIEIGPGVSPALHAHECGPPHHPPSHRQHAEPTTPPPAHEGTPTLKRRHGPHHTTLPPPYIRHAHIDTPTSSSLYCSKLTLTVAIFFTLCLLLVVMTFMAIV